MKLSKLIILFICLFSWQFSSAKTSLYHQAKQNFEKNCVRGLAESILKSHKLVKHSFKLNLSKSDEPILYGLEQAVFPNQDRIEIKNSGCESYTWQLTFHINAQNIQQNDKLCNTCLLQYLKSLSIYIKSGDLDYYLDAIKFLDKNVQQTTKLKINHEYFISQQEDIPYSITINELKKTTNHQYLVTVTIFTGPL